jgi:hypothetical protein
MLTIEEQKENIQREVFYFPRTSMHECKLFTKLPAMHVEEQRAFPAYAVIWVSFIFNVFRL